MKDRTLFIAITIAYFTMYVMYVSVIFGPELISYYPKTYFATCLVGCLFICRFLEMRRQNEK